MNLPEKDWDYHIFNSQNLYLVTRNRQTDMQELIIFDTKLMRLKKSYIEDLSMVDEIQNIVMLPESKLFAFALTNSRSTPNFSCIINTRHGIIEKTFNSAPCIPLCSTYCNNSVYVFGCSSDRLTSITARFDFINNKWEKLPIIPLSCNFSCTPFKGSILIYGAELYHFDTSTESYSEISLHYSTQICSKILMTANSRVYIFESYGSIFESEIGNEYCWKNIGKSKIQIETPGYVSNVISQEHIFLGTYIFLNSNRVMRCSYYKFDLKNKGDLTYFAEFDFKLFYF
ncbi:unnamed protein product [Blepharisma stoltei]|uniref:Uncharacterized protein n=1 Tax=Blepharisma stoltei TaxID=1481888 RepID=A0AAU9KQN7_9CILI|nr:unnamed protein product [Blepharisma stoltei]